MINIYLLNCLLSLDLIIIINYCLNFSIQIINYLINLYLIIIKIFTIIQY